MEPGGSMPHSQLSVKILKALLPSSILATCPADLNLPDLITLNNNNNNTDIMRHDQLSSRLLRMSNTVNITVIVKSRQLPAYR